MMKSGIIMLFFAFLLESKSFAQDTVVLKNKYENFTSKTGALIKIVEEPVDKVKDIKLSIFTSTDIETNQSVKALNIKRQASAFLSPTIYSSFLIDWDEIKGFATALKYIKTQVDGVKPEFETSFVYTTINGAFISCYYYKGSYLSGWHVYLGKQYKYLLTDIAGSTFELKNKNIDDLIEALQGIVK